MESRIERKSPGEGIQGLKPDLPLDFGHRWALPCPVGDLWIPVTGMSHGGCVHACFLKELPHCPLILPCTAFSRLPTPLLPPAPGNLCANSTLLGFLRGWLLAALSVPFGQVFSSNPGPWDCPSSKTSSTSRLHDVLGACSAAKRRCTNPQAGCLPPGSAGLLEENLGAGSTWVDGSPTEGFTYRGG